MNNSVTEPNRDAAGATSAAAAAPKPAKPVETGKSNYSLVVLKELVKTDFKMRYQGSLLGVAWTVLKPLMLFVVMYFVFVRFLKFTDGTPHFAMVLLLGIVLWNFFSEATNMGMQSIVSRGDLMRKVHFPNYIIVIAATLNSMISLAINLGVVIVFSIVNGVHFTWRVVLVPVGILELYAITVGVALMLATFNVYYRDIQHLWEVFLQALFYAMPIIYPLSMAVNVSPRFAELILLNPVAQTIQDIRYWLIAPETTPTTWNYIHDPWVAAIPLLLVAAVLALGIYVFNRNSRKFAEIM
ncbi:ABC transporter permease [Pseudoscardovia radai]|uniref:ABC transporter permease n=1 Tax=Pseudoscardovia radai TaxID=987066 RepID=UPI0039935C62